ncbi:hypothetical protein ACFQ0X_01435 [Streptomyces rectiviolaceus]|uniref:Transposase n=1 Tax=Streptomyces rectiviolaceus TaxID=332591 RepID=A0ABP6MBL4_9ACTN
MSSGDVRQACVPGVPVGLDVHLIVDDYGTHKAEPVRKWLLAHPRPYIWHKTAL